MGQNSFSNPNNNSNDTVFPETTVPPDNMPKEQTKPVAKKSSNGKLIAIAIISALAGAGITAAVFLLVVKTPTQEEEKETTTETIIETASPENDGTQTVEETLEEFDKVIAEADTKEEQFSLTLNKAGYYIINDDYNAAIELLNTLNVDSLENFDQYRVYNHYVSAYEGLGDTAQAEKYKALSDEALAKEFE